MPNIILEIVGTNFANYPFDNLVTFNLGAVGFVTAATPTKLTVQLTTNPTTTGSLTAVVENPLSSGSPVQVAIVEYEVIVTQNLNNIAISSSTLIINGSGFSTTANQNTVTFNNGAIGTVTAATATQLTVTFSTQPTANGSLTAIVTRPNGDSGTAVQVATIVSALLLLTDTDTYGPSEIIYTGTGLDGNNIFEIEFNLLAYDDDSNLTLTFEVLLGGTISLGAISPTGGGTLAGWSQIIFDNILLLNAQYTPPNNNIKSDTETFSQGDIITVEMYLSHTTGQFPNNPAVLPQGQASATARASFYLP